MDDVEKMYEEGKLLIRAMDTPMISVDGQNRQYECHNWIEEFYRLKGNGLFSASTTLIVPEVGIKTYKSMGFLINSEWADCIHISKTDSASCGNTFDGDFQANRPDFDMVIELANYIKDTKSRTMNEVNVNATIDSVVGLFINKSNNMDYFLERIYIVKKTLKAITGIDYPIYLYDWNIGKLELIELTKEKEMEIINKLECNRVFCWPDNVDEPFYIPIDIEQYEK